LGALEKEGVRPPSTVRSGPPIPMVDTTQGGEE